MSEIITDKLTGKTSAGNVTITSEGGSATMQLQQGVAKAWCQFTSSVVFADTFNVASGTDNGTGNFTFNITNDMNNTGYSSTLTAKSGADKLLTASSIATGSIIVEMFDSSAGTNVDGTTMATVHGDLA